MAPPGVFFKIWPYQKDLVLGPGDRTLRQLVKDSGCHIDVPRFWGQRPGEHGPLPIRLGGVAKQRRAAIKALVELGCIEVTDEDLAQEGYETKGEHVKGKSMDMKGGFKGKGKDFKGGVKGMDWKGGFKGKDAKGMDIKGKKGLKGKGVPQILPTALGKGFSNPFAAAGAGFVAPQAKSQSKAGMGLLAKAGATQPPHLLPEKRGPAGLFEGAKAKAKAKTQPRQPPPPPPGIVLPHNLNDSVKEEWLRWRLIPVQRDYEVRTEFFGQSLRLRARGGRELGEEEEFVQAAGELAVAEAHALVDLTVDAARGTTIDDAVAAISSLTFQYGVLIRAVRASLFRVVGPAGPANDAAAFLWAKFSAGPGKVVTSLLQHPGAIQAMDAGKAKELDGDLSELEQELKVEVNRSCQSILWLVGPSAEVVIEAKGTLQEVLDFYFPQETTVIKEVKGSVIDRLRLDVQLRLLMRNTTVELDRESGTIWICGRQGQAGVKQRVDWAMLADERGDPLEDESAAPATPPPMEEDFGTDSAAAETEETERWNESLGRLVSSSEADLILQRVDPLSQHLWPEEGIKALSWEVLEKFWSGMEVQLGVNPNF